MSYVTLRVHLKDVIATIVATKYWCICEATRFISHPHINVLIITRFTRWKITGLIATRTCSVFFKLSRMCTMQIVCTLETECVRVAVDHKRFENNREQLRSFNFFFSSYAIRYPILVQTSCDQRCKSSLTLLIAHWLN